jgi:hypothetical protein
MLQQALTSMGTSNPEQLYPILLHHLSFTERDQWQNPVTPHYL